MMRTTATTPPMIVTVTVNGCVANIGVVGEGVDVLSSSDVGAIAAIVGLRYEVGGGERVSPAW